MRRVAALAPVLVLALAGCKRGAGPESPGDAEPATPKPQATALGGPELVELAAGAAHICARRASGEVLCWGSNDAGQLGTPGVESRTLPKPVERLAGATRIVAGDRHSCALISDGKVLCWGSNAAGQLGDGRGRPGMMSVQPVAVRGLVDAVAVAAGGDHTCALRKAGAVLCWGDNHGGQVGNSGRAAWVAPVVVQGIRDAVAVAAGASHSCAIGQDRQVVCWGDGARGQLGDGSRGRRATPALVSGLGKVKEIAAAGDRTCALRPQGDVACWGENSDGQSGAQPAGDGVRPTPGGVTGLRGVAAIAAGEAHSCARLTSGRVVCWGRNAMGALGDGTTQARSTPVAVDLQGVSELGLGRDFSCALSEGGGVLCWGSAASSVIGDPDDLPQPTEDDGGARIVKGVAGATGVSVGDGFSCAPLESGEVACWGRNDRGQLGRGRAGAGGSTPATVSGLSDATDVAAGRAHACARRRSGQVVCWGANDVGQLGDNSKADRPSPAPVTALATVVQLAAGRDHTCARRGNGALLCWGAGASGQLGQGATEDSRRPIAVASLRGAAEVAAGGEHTCARTATGAVYCWGSNKKGELGTGAGALQLGIPLTRPALVRKVDDASGLALGAEHSCARRTNGTVACWGGGSHGALGAGTSNDWTMRIPVKNMSNALDLTSGEFFSCAVTPGGVIRCWGDNASGALGEAPRTIHRAPIVGLRLADVTAIDGGVDHTCARTKDGLVHCWGSNGHGQLGEAAVLWATTPIAIKGI